MLSVGKKKKKHRGDDEKRGVRTKQPANTAAMAAVYTHERTIRLFLLLRRIFRSILPYSSRCSNPVRQGRIAHTFHHGLSQGIDFTRLVTPKSGRDCRSVIHPPFQFELSDHFDAVRFRPALGDLVPADIGLVQVVDEIDGEFNEVIPFRLRVVRVVEPIVKIGLAAKPQEGVGTILDPIRLLPFLHDNRTKGHAGEDVTGFAHELGFGEGRRASGSALGEFVGVFVAGNGGLPGRIVVRLRRGGAPLFLALFWRRRRGSWSCRGYRYERTCSSSRSRGQKICSMLLHFWLLRGRLRCIRLLLLLWWWPRLWRLWCSRVGCHSIRIRLCLGNDHGSSPCVWIKGIRVRCRWSSAVRIQSSRRSSVRNLLLLRGWICWLLWLRLLWWWWLLGIWIRMRSHHHIVITIGRRSICKWVGAARWWCRVVGIEIGGRSSSIPLRLLLLRMLSKRIKGIRAIRRRWLTGTIHHRLLCRFDGVVESIRAKCLPPNNVAGNGEP